MSNPISKLPIELREMIFAEILLVENNITEEIGVGLSWSVSKQIFQIDKEISSHALRYYYKQNNFVQLMTTDRDFLEHFLQPVIPLKFAKLSRVRLTIKLHAGQFNAIMSKWERVEDIKDFRMRPIPEYTVLIPASYISTLIQLINSLRSCTRRAPLRFKVEECMVFHIELQFKTPARECGFTGPRVDKMVSDLTGLRNFRNLRIQAFLNYHLRAWHLTRIQTTGLSPKRANRWFDGSNLPVWTPFECFQESLRAKRQGDKLQSMNDRYGAQAQYICAYLMVDLVNQHRVHRFPEGKQRNETVQIFFEVVKAAAPYILTFLPFRIGAGMTENMFRFSRWRKSHLAPWQKLDARVLYIDILMATEKWSEAQSLLQYAISQRPEDKHVNDQIRQCKAHFAAQPPRSRTTRRGLKRASRQHDAWMFERAHPSLITLELRQKINQLPKIKEQPEGFYDVGDFFDRLS